MPKEHIFANLQTILIDVCSHRPANMGMLTKTNQESQHKSSATDIKWLQGCSSSVSSCGWTLCLIVLTALQDRISRHWLNFIGWNWCFERKSFQKMCQLLCAGWFWFPSLVQFTLVLPDWWRQQGRGQPHISLVFSVIRPGFTVICSPFP